ncbi:MAG: twin-arginine translocation signal domain-containing protein, partial [Betaproteobacteria bacterium]
MFLSRRSFVKAASVGGIGALTAPLIAARGSEALRDGILELLPPTSAAGLARFASDERAAFRIASPGAIRLDSNENPNGPG